MLVPNPSGATLSQAEEIRPTVGRTLRMMDRSTRSTWEATMRFRRSIRLPLAFVVLAAGWASPRKDDSASDQILKDKGLTKSATVFAIEEEKPVLARMKEARAAYTAYAAMAEQHTVHQELAQRAGHLEEQRAELQGQVDDLNQRIGETQTGGIGQGPGGGGGGGGGGPGGGMGGGQGRAFTSPLTIERDQIKRALAEVVAEQKTVKNQSPQAKDTTTLEARVKRAEETFKTALADLRKQVDEVRKKYADLDSDETVRKALAEVKKGNPKLHLGPSDAFLAGMKELDKAEQRFLGKRTTATVSKKRTRAKK